MPAGEKIVELNNDSLQVRQLLHLLLFRKKRLDLKSKPWVRPDEKQPNCGCKNRVNCADQASLLAARENPQIYDSSKASALSPNRSRPFVIANEVIV